MDGSPALAAAIGSRVRAERISRQWTLDQLAEQAGVSRRMLVTVEQGAANPSVSTLLRISDALGLGLPALVAPPESNPVIVTRAGQGAELWTGANGGRGVLLVGTEPPDVVELWEWTLAPGDRHDSEAHSAGTRELLQVHTGSLVIEVGGEAFTLATGDATTFSGDLPHSYLNTGHGVVRFSLAVFEPSVGSHPRKDHHG